MLRYWREALIASLAFLLLVSYTAHEHAVADRARAEERARVADSLLAFNATLMQVTDTKLVHDTVRVTRLLHTLDTLPAVRDTIYLAGDTTHAHPLVPLPAGEVATLDSLVPACRSLAHDCSEFRARATERFALYEQRLKAQPVEVRGCTGPSVLWGAVGAGAGWLTARATH